jgi:hypothetical protein
MLTAKDWIGERQRQRVGFERWVHSDKAVAFSDRSVYLSYIPQPRTSSEPNNCFKSIPCDPVHNKYYILDPP